MAGARKPAFPRAEPFFRFFSFPESGAVRISVIVFFSQAKRSQKMQAASRPPARTAGIFVILREFFSLRRRRSQTLFRTNAFPSVFARLAVARTTHRSFFQSVTRAKAV
jgi:hypothetical protein